MSYIIIITIEDRLIMKQVQLVEINSFIEIAPKYFQHVAEAIKNKVTATVFVFKQYYTRPSYSISETFGSC